MKKNFQDIRGKKNKEREKKMQNEETLGKL